ncbi:hypothetical protein V6N12_024352 [Hibiscus sabdariffa]|uniref:Uncharacterized protein n=1 Tax=Hibiscus sabdariffa TaxID=183260 RepID=A0ABR2G0C7_9ROSI
MVAEGIHYWVQGRIQVTRNGSGSGGRGGRNGGSAVAASLGCWIKGNADKAVDSTRSTAFVGGVLRDDHEMWIFGFSHSIGYRRLIVMQLWLHGSGKQGYAMCIELRTML